MMIDSFLKTNTVSPFSFSLKLLSTSTIKHDRIFPVLYNLSGFLMICRAIYIMIEMIKRTRNYIGQKVALHQRALINIKRAFRYVIMNAVATFKDRWNTIMLID